MAKVWFCVAALASVASMALACVPGCPEVLCQVLGLAGLTGTVTAAPFVLRELVNEALDDLIRG